MTKVLVVEDEPALAASIALGMRAEGFTVELASRADEGMKMALEDPPDAIVLDLVLPDRSGFHVLQEIQGRCAAPVIVLTVRTDLRDRLRCFEAGAADYMAKPFYFEELVARIRSRIRARRATPPGVVRWADAVVDIEARTVHVGGIEAELTRSEFDILAYLLQRPGRVVSRPTLARRTARVIAADDVRTVDAHVSRVRKKLGEAGSAIVTVWGVGYRFDPPAS